MRDPLPALSSSGDSENGVSGSLEAGERLAGRGADVEARAGARIGALPPPVDEPIHKIGWIKPAAGQERVGERQGRKPIHTAAQERFLALLKKARKAADLTQAEVAERLNKPQSFVAKYENGERRLDVIEFVTICRAIEADPVIMVREIASDLTRLLRDSYRLGNRNVRSVAAARLKCSATSLAQRSS
jgi:transcriptional regulator with XRE-family HTH domain